MKLANAGDREVYRTLMSELAEVVEAHLRARLGPLDMLEDCVQECLLAIHRGRRSYDPRRRFRPWLFAIVNHKTIDLLRRRGTRSRVRPDPERVALERAPDRDPTDSLDGERVLAQLEPKYREALTLTKLAGYSVPEAARQVGVSHTAMKTRVHRALRSARKLLDQGMLR